VAIRHAGHWEFNPDEECMIEPTQALIAIVSPNGRKALEAILAGARPSSRSPA
jgi:hypothetical protein